MHNNADMSLQIFQGSGFQRGGVHATSPGFHAAGVYQTVTPPPPPAPAPEPIILVTPSRKRRGG